jgi:hypothetical protein
VHGSQIVEPGELLNRPAVHNTQAVIASDEPYFPAAHSVHEPASAMLHFPATQFAQLVAPALLDVTAMNKAHADIADAVPKRPGWQSSHASAPEELH